MLLAGFGTASQRPVLNPLRHVVKCRPWTPLRTGYTSFWTLRTPEGMAAHLRLQGCIDFVGRRFNSVVDAKQPTAEVVTLLALMAPLPSSLFLDPFLSSLSFPFPPLHAVLHAVLFASHPLERCCWVHGLAKREHPARVRFVRLHPSG